MHFSHVITTALWITILAWITLSLRTLLPCDYLLPFCQVFGNWNFPISFRSVVLFRRVSLSSPSSVYCVLLKFLVLVKLCFSFNKMGLFVGASLISHTHMHTHSTWPHNKNDNLCIYLFMRFLFICLYLCYSKIMNIHSLYYSGNSTNAVNFQEKKRGI